MAQPITPANMYRLMIERALEIRQRDVIDILLASSPRLIGDIIGNRGGGGGGGGGGDDIVIDRAISAARIVAMGVTSQSAGGKIPGTIAERLRTIAKRDGGGDDIVIDNAIRAARSVAMEVTSQSAGGNIPRIIAQRLRTIAKRGGGGDDIVIDNAIRAARSVAMYVTTPGAIAVAAEGGGDVIDRALDAIKNLLSEIITSKKSNSLLDYFLNSEKEDRRSIRIEDKSNKESNTIEFDDDGRIQQNPGNRNIDHSWKLKNVNLP